MSSVYNDKYTHYFGGGGGGRRETVERKAKVVNNGMREE
jgi:hypothetical protein